MATTILITFIVALVLLGISLVAKRFQKNDRVVKFTFGGAFFFLLFSLFSFAVEIFVGDIYSDLTPDEDFRLLFVRWGHEKYAHAKLSDFGYGRLWAMGCFSGAGAGLIMAMLSRFVEPIVDEDVYGMLSVLLLALGIILLIGFSVLLEGLAFVLGIVATVVAILVGIKKLYAP